MTGKYHFAGTMRVADGAVAGGSRYGVTITADSWDDALEKAGELGCTVDGLMYWSGDTDGTEATYPTEGCAPASRPWDERIESIAGAMRTLREAGHPAIVQWDARKGSAPGAQS